MVSVTKSVLIIAEMNMDFDEIGFADVNNMMSNPEIIPNGTVTSPSGFVAGAAFAGIKQPADGMVLDLGVLCSEVSCVAAGVFTTNKVKAAPVVLCERRLKSSLGVRMIVVNSGCANACTGKQGDDDVTEMADLAATKFGLAGEDILVASTGVIGMFLPMERVRKSMGDVVLSREGGHELARAMLTTDTFPKEFALCTEIGGSVVTIGGVGKGAGMIHPDMATMLCFITTDAAVEASFLQRALRRAVDISFNMITVDGDTSTNDMVLLLANGMAGSRAIQEHTMEAEVFQSALERVCVHLAKSVARDGEGATRLLEVRVEGAATIANARSAARTVVSSPLVKAAVHGCDANWGRIMSALGRSGAELVDTRVDVYLGELCLARDGCASQFDEGAAKALLARDKVLFRICLNLGDATATAWGCDLSEDYVTINSEYTT